MFMIKWLISHLFADKGTTNNAHMQVKREIIYKKDRFIYLIRYSSLAQTCLKAKCWIADDKV